MFKVQKVNDMIDRDFRCRTGKIMKYDPANGHRIKDPTAPGKVNWVHSILKQRKLLPADWTLSQCLFGEHLLSRYPDNKVMLVESEKTALIRDAAANGTLPSNADIADWIISYCQSRNAIPVSPETDGTEETPATASAVASMTAKCPELRLLMDELGLEVVSESLPI